MNESLVNKLVKCKLEAVNAIVDSLPEPLSGELKSLQQVVFQSIREFEQEQGGQTEGEKSKEAPGLKSISVE